MAKRMLLAAALVAAAASLPNAQSPAAKQGAVQWIDANAATWQRVNRNIWGYAETGLQETKSSQELMAVLRENGFNVESGVAGMPTAFVASFGSGKPVIGILAEYDALPGLSQDA